MRANRVDVARMAGVSTTTVTNVLNDRKNVSEEVKKKVLQVMAELDYKPNLIARSLITNRSSHIAILLEDITDLHHSLIVDNFQKVASEKGYFLSICLRNGSLEDLFDSFISRGIEGVFMMISLFEYADGGSHNVIKLIQRLSACGVKVVVGFNGYHDLSSFSTIECDFGDAVEKSVEFLASLGHRNIGLLNIFDKEYTFDNRYSSFVKSMKNVLGVENPAAILGLPPYPGHIDTGELYTARLMAEYPDTTAIIGTNDLLAIGSVSYLINNGYRVPEDVSVMAIGDVAISRYFKPSLSAMSVDFVEYGRAACNMLLNSIEMGNSHISLHKLSLSVRQTTAVVKEEANLKIVI